MRAGQSRLASWVYPLLIVLSVAAFWRSAWHDGLGAGDLPGHVALISTLERQLSQEPGIPLWTPDWYAGSSLVLCYLHPIFSLLVLWPFTAFWGVVEGLRIGDSVFLALAGVAMYAWCLEFGRSRRGAFVGAVVYVLHPSVFSIVGAGGHVHQPVSMAIIPLLFLGWTVLASRPSLKSCLLAAIPSALLFLDMERFWIVFPFVLVTYFFTAASKAASGDLARAALGAAVIACAVAAVMALLLCFPALPGLRERSLLQWHHTAGIDLFRRLYSFPHLFALVDRNGWLARDLDPLLPESFAATPGQFYQGLVALAFVAGGALGLVRERKDPRRRSRLALMLSLWVAALWLAFGVQAIGPRHLRLFGDVGERGVQGYLVVKLLLLGAVLTLWFGAWIFSLRAALLDQWPRHPLLTSLVLGIVGLLLLFVAPFAMLARVVFVYAHIRAPGHFAFPMLGFLLGVSACLVTPTWERILRTPSRIALALGGLILLHSIDVLPYRDHLRRSYPREVVAELKDAYGSLKDRPAGRILDAQHYDPLADMLGAAVARRPSGWGWLSWSSSRFTSDVIRGGVYRSLARAGAAGRSGASEMEAAADLSALANIRYLSRIAFRSPPLPASEFFRPVWESPRIEIFENLQVLPHLQFYPRLALVSGSTQEIVGWAGRLARDGIASYTLADSGPAEDLPRDLRVHFWHGDRARALSPESARPIGIGRRPGVDWGRGSSDRAAPCDVVRREAARIELHCQFAREGYLVVAESWFPGWDAAVDGERRPVIRLNHAFQGLQVSAGVAAIDFWYEPSRWVELSMLISGLGWAGVSVLGIGCLCSALRRALVRKAGS